MEAPTLWISFPPGKLETEGRADKTAASRARGIFLRPGMLANCLLFTFGIAIPKLPNAWEFGHNLADTSDPAQLPPPGGPTACQEGEAAPGPGEQ